MQDDDGLVTRKKNRPKSEKYIIDFLMGEGKPNATVACMAPNLESVASVCGIIVATNWPGIVGYNLYRYNPEYDYDREFLMHVPAMQMAMQFANEIQSKLGIQVFKSVIPVIPSKAEGEDIQKLADEAKKNGRKLL